MSDVEPALTVEEWEEALDDGFQDEFLEHLCESPIVWRMIGDIGYPGLYHPVAALALHDQSFGFTWRDVDSLREAATLMEAEWRGIVDESQLPENLTIAMTRKLWDISERIAALLPPRSEGDER